MLIVEETLDKTVHRDVKDARILIRLNCLKSPDEKRDVKNLIVGDIISL